VEIRDGSSTLFWHDHWLSPGPLVTTHPSLFSHTLGPNISVQQVFQGEFDLCLRPRLTRAAIAELDSFLAVLQGIHLQEGQDVRRLTTTQLRFSSKDVYDALSPSPSIQDFHGRWIWQTKVPNKVKIFAWLYFKDRLSTKANLFYKNVKEDAICSHCEHPIEDRHHTFFGCPLSRDTWNTIGLGLLSTMDDTDVWTLPTAVQQDPATWPSILLTILWCLWEARNGTIFRSDNARSDWPYLR
jgi:hypothetical protein